MEFCAIPEGGGNQEGGDGRKLRIAVGFIFKNVFYFSRNPVK